MTSLKSIQIQMLSSSYTEGDRSNSVTVEFDCKEA